MQLAPLKGKKTRPGNVHKSMLQKNLQRDPLNEEVRSILSDSQGKLAEVF
jgi:hypothetical protein